MTDFYPFLILAVGTAIVVGMIIGARLNAFLALIMASGMMGGMIHGAHLRYNPADLGTATGRGALLGSWMNDSGFWIFSRMSGFTEMETLKSWTPLLCVLGGAAFLASVVLSMVLPLAR